MYSGQMHLTRRRRAWRGAIPLILLTMILARLVWMQLRSYQTGIDPVVAEVLSETSQDDPHCDGLKNRLFQSANFDSSRPKSLFRKPALAYSYLAKQACAFDKLEVGQLTRLNQWLYCLTTFFYVLGSRFLTGSWTLSLTIGTMLLSRGSMLASLGLLSTDHFAALGLSFIFASLTHHLRTGAKISLAGAAGGYLWGTLFDLQFVAVGFGVGAAFFIMHWQRHTLVAFYQERLAQLQSAFRYADSENYQYHLAPSGGRWTVRIRNLLGFNEPKKGDYQSDPRKVEPRIFRPLGMPYGIWGCTAGRAFKTGLVAFGYSLIVLIVVLVNSGRSSLDLSSTWPIVTLAADATTSRHQLLSNFVEQRTVLMDWLDLHVVASLVVVALSVGMERFHGVFTYRELVWIVASVGFSLLVFNFIGPASGMSLASALHWMEPLILTMGIIATLNIAKVAIASR